MKLTKKIATTALMAMALTSSVMANDSYKNLTLEAKAGQVSVDGTSSTAYGASFGIDYRAYNGFAVETEIEALQTADSVVDGSDSSLYFSMNIGFGYEVVDNFVPYVFVGYGGIEGENTYSYGARLKWQVVDNIALDVKYERANILMTVGDDIPMDNITAGIEFNFRTSK